MATVEQQLNGLGVGVGTLFQRQYSFCCLDTEAYLPSFFATKSSMFDGKNDSRYKSLPYSTALEFITTHELLLVVLSYRLPNDTQIQTRLFWRRQDQLPKELLREVIRFLNQLSDTIYERLRDGDFKSLLERLDDMAFDNSANQFLVKQITSARKSVLRFIRRMLVITYNGSRYDIPLLRRYGLLQLLKEEGGNFYFSILKRSTSYLAITTDKIRLVDILNFTPHKTTLRQFLKCFGISQEEGKLVFPHGSVRCLRDVDKPISAISYSDFRDFFLNRNSLNESYRLYCRLRRNGLGEDESLKQLGVEKRPLSGPSTYHQLMAYWHAKGHLTIRDILSDYARHDTQPLTTAIIGFMQAFEQLWLGDIVHSFVSLSQASLSYFMRNKESDESFTLVSKEIYFSMKEHMVGGPCIVYRRLAEPNSGRKCREWELGPDKSEPIRGLTSLDITSHYANVLGQLVAW